MQTKQNGVALITALLIMAIVAIIACAVSIVLSIDIRRTELTLNNTQLYLADQGVLFWAEQNLLAQLTSAPTTDAEQQFEAKNFHDIDIHGSLIDLQSRININNTLNPLFQNNLVSLLKNTADISAAQAKQINQAIIQQITEDAPVPKNSTPPLNHPYNNIQALQWLPGLTPTILNRIAPALTTLPSVTPININSAPLAVLMTLGNGLTEAQATQIMTLRTQAHGFTTVSQCLQNPLLSSFANQIQPSTLTVASQYFLVRARDKLNSQSLQVTWLLRRDVINHQVIIRVLWQSLGSFGPNIAITS